MGTWLIATGALIQAGAVVFAALYAKGQLAEFRESREQTTRPFVVIDLETWQTIATLKIKNIGQTIARNVRLSFSPTLTSTFDGQMGGGSYHLIEIDMLANGIPSLAPGRELSTLFDQVPQRLEAGLPNRYEVKLTYEGPNGKNWTDDQVLSLDTHIGLTRVERKGAHEIAKSLAEIAREVKRWSAFGGGSGLRIVTEADMRERYERFLESQAEEPSDRDADPKPDAPEEEAA